MPAMKVMKGWVILHPDGHVETDNFQRQAWNAKGEKLSREAWRKKYRPDCVMVAATLCYQS